MGRGSVRRVLGSVFDLDVALQRIDGDRDLLMEAVDIFLESAPALVAQIRSAVRRSDTTVSST